MVKKVLIERAELDRLQQRQLQEYSPETHSLARLQTQIEKVLSRKDISAERKLDLIISYETRFNKLKTETGVLTGNSSKVQTLPSVKPKELIEKISKSEVDDDEDLQHDADEESITEDEDAVSSRRASPERELDDFQRMKFKAKHEAKARQIYDRIMNNPTALSRNEIGEMVINGRDVPGTDFTSLFQSLFASKDVAIPPGIDDFLEALYHLGVTPNEITNKRVKDLYAKPLLRGTVKERLAKYKEEVADPFNAQLDVEIAAEIGKRVSKNKNIAKLLEDLGVPPHESGSSSAGSSPKSTKSLASSVKSQEVVFKPTISHPPLVEAPSTFEPPSASTAKSSKQSGKGRPPGRKPNILYVY